SLNASLIKNSEKEEMVEERNKKDYIIQENYIDAKESNSLVIGIDNLKELLIKNNKDLSKYKSQINQSKAILKTKLASWYPKFTMNSNELPKYNIGNDIRNTGNDTSSKQSTFGVNANIEWDLIKPERRLEIKIARDQLLNSKSLYSSSIEELYLESLKLFYSIQASFEEINVANKSIEISKIALKEATEKLKSGIGNKLELLEAKIQLNRDEIDLINKLGNLRKNKNSLAEILNIDEEIIIQKENVKNIEWIWTHNLEDSLLSAYQNRLDLRIKEKNIIINRNKSLSTLSGKKPSFKIYNNYSISTSNGETGVTSIPDYSKNTKSNLNSVGIKFSWNIFDGGLIKQNYISLKEKSNELEEDLLQNKLEIKKELLDSIVNLEIAKKNIILSFDQLKSAKETLAISLKRMEAGLSTQREVVNVQADVAEAESNFINSITNYNKTLVKLERISLLKKSDICSIKNYINSSNNEFYEFIVENKLNDSCKVII
ncbi:TolC family protein, partial [uncultured Prochlorococcus sp.]|uniref:TolC family protein n=1 Tax=uncultured Prochlorococcus sp. TaxID=159733 RepID=UPI00258F42EF